MGQFGLNPAHAVPNWQAPAGTEKKRPAIEEPRGGGHRQNFQLLDAAQKNKTPDENATVEVNVVPHGDGGAPDLNGTPHGCEDG